MDNVNNDRDSKQFVMMVDGEKAFIDYSFDGTDYKLLHAEVPAALRGKGVGERLVEQTFAKIAEEGKSAEARCSYVKHVAKSTGKWDDLVSY